MPEVIMPALFGVAAVLIVINVCVIAASGALLGLFGRFGRWLRAATLPLVTVEITRPPLPKAGSPLVYSYNEGWADGVEHARGLAAEAVRAEMESRGGQYRGSGTQVALAACANAIAGIDAERVGAAKPRARRKVGA